MAPQQPQQPQQPRAAIRRYGPWQIPISASHVLCSDGKRRYARITGQADTMFSIPAAVKVKGRTVSGFITGGFTFAQDLHFVAYSDGVNGHLLPGIPGTPDQGGK